MSEDLFEIIMFIITIIVSFVTGVKCGKNNVSDD